MTQPAKTPPVILIGMHRSGTTLLAEALARLGVYMGPEGSSHSEARFFHDLNVRMMQTSGGSWEYPELLDRFLAIDTLRQLQAEYLESLFSSPQLFFYLGAGRYLQYRSLFKLDFAWGWKDPRNTYTLPCWLDVFPDAKVINIERHGVDVASSLATRFQRQLDAAVRRHKSRMPKYRFRPKQSHFIDTIRCARLDDGLALWASYMQRGRDNLQRVPEANRLSLRYEDVLQRPRELLAQAATFCGARFTDADLDAMAGHIRSRRAGAYRHDPELLAFARDNRATLERFGYSAD